MLNYHSVCLRLINLNSANKVAVNVEVEEAAMVSGRAISRRLLLVYYLCFCHQVNLGGLKSNFDTVHVKSVISSVKKDLSLYIQATFRPRDRQRSHWELHHSAAVVSHATHVYDPSGDLLIRSQAMVIGQPSYWRELHYKTGSAHRFISFSFGFSRWKESSEAF